MFQSARLKLTLWYLLIIMLISLSFSFVIYRVQSKELDSVANRQQVRIQGNFRPGSVIRVAPEVLGQLRKEALEDQKMIVEAKGRLKKNLLLINLLIFASSALAGYFLAGRTLRPIQDMVDDQKRFISDASHELRTPITAMKTETEVTLIDKGLNLKSAKDSLKSNLEELDKMESLVNYFLSLSRYGNFQSNLQFEKLNLKIVIESAIKNLANQAKSKKITLDNSKLINVDISGNKTSLTQLVTILIDNAIKYSEPENQVNVRLFIRSRQAVIEIEDHGLGIKASDLPHVFNRFYRADSSRSKDKVSGFGLGLAIAKSIVLRHQGKIIAESELGKGSTFIVSLPLKQIST